MYVKLFIMYKYFISVNLFSISGLFHKVFNILFINAVPKSHLQLLIEICNPSQLIYSHTCIIRTNKAHYPRLNNGGFFFTNSGPKILSFKLFIVVLTLQTIEESTISGEENMKGIMFFFAR